MVLLFITTGGTVATGSPALQAGDVYKGKLFYWEGAGRRVKISIEWTGKGLFHTIYTVQK